MWAIDLSLKHWPQSGLDMGELDGSLCTWALKPIPDGFKAESIPVVYRQKVEYAFAKSDTLVHD